MKRLSPKEPCPFCGGRAWFFREVRWQCEDCPGTGKVKDFNGWYKSVMDDWETISRTLADIERTPEPETWKDILILAARKSKAEDEYKRADALAQVATSLRLMVDGIEHGRFSISVFDMEIDHEW